MISDIDTNYRECLKTEIVVCVDCIEFDHTNKEVLKHKEKIVNLEEQINILLKDKIDSKKEMDDLKAKFYKMSKDVSKILKNSEYKHTYGA